MTETWSRRIERYIAEGRTVSGGKGGDVAKQQLDLQNKLTQQAFDLMQKRQAEVEGGVGKYISGNIGFDPQQLALMRSQFLNQNALNYNSGAKNIMSALARRGSVSADAPVGGDFTRGIASLEGAAASDRSSGLANIDLANLQQALTNKFNAASLINGQAAQLTSPISSFNSGAGSALNSYVTAVNSGPLNQLLGGLGMGFGEAFGGAAGKGLAGGFGKLFSGGGQGNG